MPHLLAQPMLTEADVSALTKIPVGTLRTWRCQGAGPRYFKLGNGPKARVRYTSADVEAFIEAGRREPITLEPKA